MKRILIFSGTTEGRKLAEHLSGRAAEVFVSVATEYGKACMEEGGISGSFRDGWIGRQWKRSLKKCGSGWSWTPPIRLRQR